MNEPEGRLTTVREVFNALVESDTAIKLLFDHLRNVGICAAVFIAATWKYRHIAPFLYGAIIDWIMFGVLVLFGLFLFFANQWHGVRKVKDPRLPPWVYTVVVLIYSMVTITIIASVARVDELVSRS